MANHKSAQKRANQSEIRRLRNRTVKSKVKNAVKNLKLFVSSNTKSESEIKALFNNAKSIIDISAKKGVLHRKTASRKISRLSKMMQTHNT